LGAVNVDADGEWQMADGEQLENDIKI